MRTQSRPPSASSVRRTIGVQENTRPGAKAVRKGLDALLKRQGVPAADPSTFVGKRRSRDVRSSSLRLKKVFDEIDRLEDP